jgi:hypothetical protein
MRPRLNSRLTRQDREAVSRWWRFMLPVVFIVVLTLLGAERAYQTLWPAAPSTQVADETSPAPRNIEFSQARSAR